MKPLKLCHFWGGWRGVGWGSCSTVLNGKFGLTEHRIRRPEFIIELVFAVGEGVFLLSKSAYDEFNIHVNVSVINLRLLHEMNISDMS